MRNLLLIAGHMIKRTLGSRRNILFYLLLPAVIVSLVFWATSTSNSRQAILLYANLDQGAAGAHLIAQLAAADDYSMTEVTDEAELKQQILDGKGEAGLFIPADFTLSLLKGSLSQPVFYELKLTEASALAQVKVEQYMAQLAAAVPPGVYDEPGLSAMLAQAGRHLVGSVRTDYGLYPSQTLRVMTGFTLLFLMGFVTTSVSLVTKDRKERTLLRVFSAPVRSWQITGGHFMGSVFVGVLQIALILLIGRYVLQYEYNLSVPVHFVILAVFMLAAMGIASFAASLIRRSENAGMLNSLILTPTCMLGGCFWPISIMPEYMQLAANFTPQKWAIQAVQVAAVGGGWRELWQPLAIMALMAAVLLALGSATLRPGQKAAG